MNDNKEKGNEHFKKAANCTPEASKEEYNEALSYYKTSLNLAK